MSKVYVLIHWGDCGYDDCPPMEVRGVFETMEQAVEAGTESKKVYNRTYKKGYRIDIVHGIDACCEIYETELTPTGDVAGLTIRRGNGV